MKQGLSPMMKQYLDIKASCPDQILFFRLGDFYEMFFDDAVLASKELELTLTGRDCGMDERAPMCGVPYHSCEGYIARLIKKGYKVAICEQTEDPSKTKDIVKREVVRVITPGTVIESNMLEENKNNYIAGLYLDKSAAGLCFADVSTGDVHVTHIEGPDRALKVLSELVKFSPAEILFNKSVLSVEDIYIFIKDRLTCAAEVMGEEEYDQKEYTELIEKQFGSPLPQLKLQDKPCTLLALGCILSYIQKTQSAVLERIATLNYYEENEYLKLDASARQNLELTETIRTKERRGSLLWVLDHTKTPMGKRLLRSYIEMPLMNCILINKRLGAVEELVTDYIRHSTIGDALSGIFDIERLITRIVCESVSPRELISLYQTIQKLPALKEPLQNCKSQLLSEIYGRIDLLEDVAELIQDALEESAPLVIKEGGIIKSGYNKSLDELRDILNNGKQYLAAIEAAEKEKTGIKNLKIGYNKVFGYYIEITNSFLSQVPDEYIRKQTLSNCERYITEELKILENKILSASEKIGALEYELFCDIRAKVSAQKERIQKTASAVAQCDVLYSFAEAAIKGGYCRPTVNMSDRIEIKNGRHPVVEKVLKSSPFVPNDAKLDCLDNRMLIITGPNMSGKSTYMRQVAISTLMAQIGSFVPADSAEIGVCDAIFTRIGASDDLSSGQSTFMVEMNEVSYILKNATKKSLIVLDEVGRGTSTFDGMSIAMSVVEYILSSKGLGCKTLFATHYHELSDLENRFDGVRNYSVAVKRRGEEIVFLHKIIRGSTDDSYGIEVARLAGLPASLLKRAKDILFDLEEGSMVRSGGKSAPTSQTAQVSLDLNPYNGLIDKLKNMDENHLSPIEALNILFELKALLK